MSSNSSSSPDVPPFYGYVDTTIHALRLIHAARQGVIPRITRRLNDTERRTMIKSGSVFVFSVEESGIKRWTDGLLWSPSRIVGNFLVYREINERASSRGGPKKPYPSDDLPSRSATHHGHSPSSMYKGLSLGVNDQGTFKSNGLLKKTITVTIDGSDLHLISYYTHDDLKNGRLKKPTSRQDIMALHMPPHIFRLTNFRVPPKVEMGPDGKARLVTEPEDPPTIECKVEEDTYSSPSSIGSLSPVDIPYPGSSLYPIGSHFAQNSPTTQAASCTYRSNTSHRWPDGRPTAAPSSRMSLSPVSSFGGSARRDTSILSSPEPTWGYDAYDSSSPTSTSSAGFNERPRLRSVNPYPTTMTPRAYSSSDGYGRYSSAGRYREISAAPRSLPWLLNSDGNVDSKENIMRTPSRASNPYPTSMPFSMDGYGSYQQPSPNNPHSWADNLNTDVNCPHSPAPFAPHSHSAIHHYDNHYSPEGKYHAEQQYSTSYGNA